MPIPRPLRLCPESLLITILLTCCAAADAEELECDLLIVGGTESGCAAAVQAARSGVGRIVLVNDLEWLGGQFSAEALGAIDENRARGGTSDTPFPRSGLFLEVIERIEAVNLAKYGRPRPGNAIVRNTVRPADAATVFQELLAPLVSSGQLRIVSGHYPVSALLERDGDQLAGLRFARTEEALAKELAPGETPTPTLVVRAPLTIDASDWGEAIRVAGAEHESGPDAKSKYGEPHAFDDEQRYPPTEMNPITWNLVIVESDSTSPIERPEGYDERRYYLETTHTAEEHRRLNWPHGQRGGFGDMARVYQARRIVDGGPEGADVLLLNRPVQNYPLDRLPQHIVDALERDEPGAARKNIVEMTRRQRELIFADAKRQALGFLYFLQTAVHDRLPPDSRLPGEGGKSPSLRRFVLTDEFGTPDRLPPKPYIRESLRLRALYMMREQETLNARAGDERYAPVMYSDGVLAWQFEYDYHPTGRGFLAEGPAGPWECYFKPGRGWGVYSARSVFPLRSLIPIRVDGLLGAQKNLGYSSLVCSAVRLHDQSMAIGQAAGAAAAVCLRHQVAPRRLPAAPALLTEVREALCVVEPGKSRQPLVLWPFRDVAPDHAAFAAIQLLATSGDLPLSPTEVDFRPDEPADPKWCQDIVTRSLRRKRTPGTPDAAAPPRLPLTRGEFARRWWETLRTLDDLPVPQQAPDDADGDGRPDLDDSLPYDPRPES